MKKIAFLFLVKNNHNCKESWDLFFKNVNKLEYTIYCHYKKKPSDFFLVNNILSRCIPTQWADISLVRATLLLLAEAFKDPSNHYFILLSDSCIPIINFNLLKKKIFKIDKSIIHFKHQNNKLNRYQQLHPLLKQKLSFKYFYCQHQWMLLKRDIVEQILSFDLTHYYSRMGVPDEHYFINLIFLLNLQDRILNKKMTYCNWDNCVMHPKSYENINPNLLQNCIQNDFFFFRKITSNFRLTPFFYNLISKN
jgi:hypothetical protein